MPATPTAPPLDGVRVFELSTGYAAGLAGRLLRGYGASVLRAMVATPVPLTLDEDTYLHAGKQSLSSPVADSGWWDEQLDAIDLVLSDHQPRELAGLGIDWHAVRSRHPHLVIVSVTPFGLTGPYADYRSTNAVSFAMGGIMSLTGEATRTPLVTGGNQAFALAGLNAFAAAVTAWFGRVRTGARGDLVDISAQECAAGMLELYGPTTAYGWPVLRRLGNSTRAVWSAYPCKDGWAGIFCLERQVPALFALLDDAELDEPRFRDPFLRVEPETNDLLSLKLFLHCTDRTKAELLEEGRSRRVPIGAVLTPRDLLRSDALRARGAFDRVGTATVPGRPFPGFGWVGAQDGPVPDGPSDGEPAARSRSPRPSSERASAAQLPGLPMAGVRVVDLSMMWAGPYATMRMAEMGADVIKVEAPRAWDNVRTLLHQPGVPTPWNTSPYFNANNRDKRSLTLDLASDRGREILLRLVAQSDVLIENYRADVLDRLGLGYEVLRTAKPDIVLVSMAAFGKECPDRDYVGFGPVIEQMSGLASLSGYGDGEPFKTGLSYGDPVAGTAAVAATVLGLLQRDATGEGCHIDLAQREVAMTLIGEAFVAASAREEDPVHRGCRDARFAPQGCYRTKGDDAWMVVSVRTDAEWRALCTLVDRPELSDLLVHERRARHDELDEVIEEWTRRRRPQDAMEVLQAAGVPAGRVLDTGEVLDDLQLLHRDYWVYVPHPLMHRYKQQGTAWRLHDSEPTPRRWAPMFGEHNREILQGLLGLNDVEIGELADSMIIADAPVNPTVG